MAWQSKRRYPGSRPRRWSGRRPTTAGVARQLNRKANKRFVWTPVVDILCNQQAGDCKGCCTDPEFPDEEQRGCTYGETGVLEESSPTPQALVLIPPAPVPADGATALYAPDSITVVRTVGRIEFCPVFCFGAEVAALCASDPLACATYREFSLQFRNYHLRAALDKSKWEWDPLTRAYTMPSRFPLETHEWTDAQFLRQWERHKGAGRVNTNIVFNGNAPLGCCGDVSAAGAGAPANTLSNGSGTVNIPAISTDCQPCNADAEDTFRSYSQGTEWMPCFSLSLNSRRRLTFKENEGLTLWWDYTSFTPFIAPTPGWRPNVSFAYRVWMKALLEVAG